MPGISRQQLEQNQIRVYAVALGVGVLVGIGRPEWASFFERLIYPILGALLYVTFLQIPFREFRRALGRRRYLAAALTLNFIAAPAVAWLLTRAAPQEPAVLLGIFLVLLTPCIDYVIVFTGLAGGDERLVLASTPLLMMLQLALLPLYLWLFMGGQLGGVVTAGPFLEPFFVLIALPLALALATEAWASRSPGAARVASGLAWATAPLMAATLLAVTASQMHELDGAVGDVARVVPIYLGFFLIMPLLAWVAAHLLAFDYTAGRALMFTSATRNSLVVLPLALGLPAAFSLTATVIVTQTLVELAALVLFVRLAPRLFPAAS